MYMDISDLTQIELLRAIFTLAFVALSFTVGLRILVKYFKYKNSDLITVGLSWIFLSSPWWPLAFTLVSVLLFNYAFDPIVYLYLMTGFVPVALIFWTYSFASLVYKDSKLKVFLPFLIICGLYMVIYHTFLIVDSNLIAVYGGRFEYQRTMFVTLFLIFAIAVTLITGTMFGLKSLQSSDTIIRLKGKFLLIAFFSFVTAALLETFSYGSPVLQTLVRVILITASIEYYLGFFMPDKVAEMLIKK